MALAKDQEVAVRYNAIVKFQLRHMSESVKVFLDLDSVIWRQFLDRWWSKKKGWPTLELSNYPIEQNL